MSTFDSIWEEIHNETEWGKYPSEEAIRFVARNYYNRSRKETRILDAGCGTGAITWYLSREGFDVYAYDGSESALKKAHDRLLKENLNANIIVGDASNTGYESGYFDGIIDSAMICANTSNGIKLILKECYRILKQEGKLFSTGLFKVGMTGYDTGMKLEENTYREITEGALRHRGTVHFFDEKQIIDFWSEAGFRNIKIDSLERTDMGGTINVRYFMVEALK